MEARMTWVAVFLSLCCFVHQGHALSGSTNVWRAKVILPVSVSGSEIEIAVHTPSKPLQNFYLQHGRAALGDDSTSCQRSRGLFITVFLFCHNVVFEAKPGASPVLVMMNENDEHIETIDLSPMTERECNELLKNKGFFMKAHAGEQVPEKYLQGPYEGIQQEPQKNDL